MPSVSVLTLPSLELVARAGCETNGEASERLG
jgi:hypothetical protein